MFIFYSLRKMRKKGLNQKQVVLVGYSRAAEEYIDRIQQNPQWGYVVRGILDDNITAGTMYKGVKVIGRIANLNVILPESRLDEIAITLGLSEYYRLEAVSYTHLDVYKRQRGLENTPEKKARLQKEVDHFRERYSDFLKKGDPYYNPNLSIVRGDCAFRMAYEKKDEIV